MIQFVKVTAASWAERVRALLVQIRGAGAAGDDEGAVPDDGVEVAQPLGLRARPVISASLEGVMVEQENGDRVVLVLIDKSRGAGAVEAEVGETQLHGLAEQSAVVRIRASGDIELTPKVGRNVIVAGGTLKVARETDGVRIGNITASAPPGGGPVVFVFTPVNAAGVPGAPSAASPTLSLGGVISSADCAEHFKG